MGLGVINIRSSWTNLLVTFYVFYKNSKYRNKKQYIFSRHLLKDSRDLNALKTKKLHDSKYYEQNSNKLEMIVYSIMPNNCH